MSWTGLGFSKFIGLSCNQFINYLDSCLENHTYWHQSPSNYEYKLSATKNSFNELEQSFKRLTFREITLIGYAFKYQLQGDYKNAQLVLLAFKYMRNKKITHQQKLWFFTRQISQLWDCLQNKLEGHGFTTSTAISYSIILDLEKIPPPPPPLPVLIEQVENPIPPEENKKTKIKKVNFSPAETIPPFQPQPISEVKLPSTNTPPKTELRRATSEKFQKHIQSYTQAIERTGSLIVGSKTPLPVNQMSLEKYKNAYETCTEVDKLWIIRNISQIKARNPNLNSKKPSYLTDLLSILCENEEYDLSHQMCINAILDMFYFKTEKEQDLLAQWIQEEGLKEKTTVTLSLLQQVLQTLTKRLESKGSVSFHAVSVLMLFYKSQCDKAENISLPYQPEIVEMGLSLMLIIQLHNNQTTSLVEWLSRREDFKIEDFKKLKQLVIDRCQDDASYPIRCQLLGSANE